MKASNITAYLDAQEMEMDKQAAIKLLERCGYAFRIYGREDVDRMLDLLAQDENEPLDTRTFREEIVDHVMQGDDWPDMSKKGYDDETTLWNIIGGTRHDHPEWFIG